MKKFLNNQSGQSLITLLFFMVIGVTVISAAALIVAADMLSVSNSENGLAVYCTAESGAEDALLRLLRNPTLATTTPYAVLSNDGSASVSIQSAISGGTITDTIISTGTSGTTTRKIQVITTYVDGVLAISSWKEIN